MKHDDNIHETPDVTYIHNEGTFHEASDVNVKSIAWFAFGLFILTVVTFGLIKGMEWGFDKAAKASAAPPNPMAMKDPIMNLPPEPRLQTAPGFGYTKKTGERVNLELVHPNSEWEQVKADYDNVLKNGLKAKNDKNEDVMMVEPIEKAEEEVLKEGLPTRKDAKEEMLRQSREMPAFSSSGRTTELRKQ